MKNSYNRFHISFSRIFSMDKNVIEMYNNEDVKLFCQDLVVVILKRG